MYAELLCQSCFSFLQAASRPEELVERAGELGYRALALTDECSVAGVVRAHEAARERNLQLIVGSLFRLPDGAQLLLLPRDRRGYGQLCRLITHARRQAEKGGYRLQRADLEQGLSRCLALLLAEEEGPVAWFAGHFGDRGWLALALLRRGDDAQRLARQRQWSRRHGLPLAAVGAVRMHDAARQPLLDTLSAIRLRRPVSELGADALPNAECHLRPPGELARLYPPELLSETLRIAELCRFSLDEVRYQYPEDVAPEGLTPRQFLRQLTEQGVERRWPHGCPSKVRLQVEHELELIAELHYEPYFLTVWDIVRHARERAILCQGRGSAANSAVCYCLGITEVDPARMNLLFERFISRERGEPPDIDVDFEHERREEVIQYIYAKYGRQRAALAATVITYRVRSALRDVGKALGFAGEQVEALVAAVSGWRRHGELTADQLAEAGFDPHNPRLLQLLLLVNEIRGFPRHLSQHVGGFVIAQGRLDELVPIENAAMPGRTVIQWEKDDLESLGLLKIDILALGMLSAIRRTLALLNHYRELRSAPWPALDLASIPPEDPATYAMIQRGDTIGVFQIESRAQMSMLPRLRPANFYDLVIEVAIVRPGPIQGDMVHPYLRRRQGKEAVSYPSAAVREVLERTLGVPIFQEQVIKLAMVAAGFSPGEADRLRRAMAAWRRRGGLEPYRDKLLRGLAERGYGADFAERIYRQILGFGEYGFPESHSASFALLVYVSAWLKRHHPAAFCAALINSQPMGFYQPAQLVRDAREHGVTVLPVDVRHSQWDCSLEPGGAAPALRLGLRLLAGLSRDGGARVVAARERTPFKDAQDLARRAALNRRDLKALAAGDALRHLAGHRYRAAWAVAGVDPGLPLFGEPSFDERDPKLPPPSEGRELLADYAQLGLSLRRHPLSLLRAQLTDRRLLSAEEVGRRAPGSIVRAAGLVLVRQRPGQGKAVFVTLEDETGVLNLLVWADLAERRRQVLLGAGLLGVEARIQRVDGVQHLICRRLEDHSDLLGELDVRSRDFH
jgi:error-prone DNA polymerase